MALSIKTEEADRLARELASATHESLTDAVTTALRERLDRFRGSRRSDLAFSLDRLVVDFAAWEEKAGKSDDDLVGYGESGEPA